MSTLYRADRNADRLTTLAEGWCLTDDEGAARAYARAGGTIAIVEIDLDSLNVVEVEGYDRNENETPADSAAFRAAHRDAGADVLRYEDESEDGRQHTTWRIVSGRALAACRVAAVRDIE